MLLRVCWGRQYSALQHADALVDAATTCNRIRRGQKSFVEGCMNERYDGRVSSDVFRDEMFVCYCKCIGGVNTVHCNTLMQL